MWWIIGIVMVILVAAVLIWAKNSFIPTDDQIDLKLSERDENHKSLRFHVHHQKYLVRSRQEHKYTIGQQVELKPQPANSYDKKAIGVFAMNGSQIGWIAKDQNRDLSKYLLNGGSYYAEIDWIGGEGYNEAKSGRYAISNRAMVQVNTTEKVELDFHSTKGYKDSI